MNGKSCAEMKKYLSLIVVGILFFACQPTNELGTPFHKGQEVSLTASIDEQRPQMLPGMQRNGRPMLWA